MGAKFLNLLSRGAANAAASAVLILALAGAGAASAGSIIPLAGPGSSPQRLAQAPGTSSGPSAKATSEVAPVAADYWFSAIYKDDTIVLDGYVPDKVLLTRLSQTFQVDVDNLEIASGAPARFASSVDFGLRLLSRLHDGRFSIRSNVLTIKGSAATASDYQAAIAMTKTGIPEGSILALAEISPPKISPFVWSAEKVADGSVSFSGVVPDDETRNALIAAANKLGKDAMAYAAGNPEGFKVSALSGLGLLAGLDSGKISFDGARWSLDGSVDSPENAAKAKAAFASSGLSAAGWSFAIKTSPAPEPADSKAISPYEWSAQKAENGVFSFSGYVPDAGFQRIIASRAGNVGEDTSKVADGAPKGFTDDAVAGFAALSNLVSGRLKYDGTHWALSGVAASEGEKANMLKALTFATDAGTWTIAIGVKYVAPSPKAAVQPAPAPKIEPVPVAAAKPEVKADYRFAATKPQGGAIALSGMVPAEAAKSYFGVIAGDVSPANLVVTPGAPEDFIASATTGLRTLVTLESGQLSFDGAKWSLKGKAPTPEGRVAALAAVDALSAGKNWLTEIAAPTAIEICRYKLSAFSAENAILFDPASSHLTEGSVAALASAAGALAACPDAYIYVEGHTDSDGDENRNLALSVARSEAVIAALVAAGARTDRLYAVGYGESAPVADNETPAGKQANRRIVFTILDKPL